MATDDLETRSRELVSAARRLAEAVGGEVRASRLPAVTEEVEDALRYVAMTFNRLASRAEGRAVGNELFALSELCRAAYRQAWAARQALTDLTGEPR